MNLDRPLSRIMTLRVARTISRRIAAAWLLLAAAQVSIGRGDGVVRTVARTGQQAPDLADGVTFSTFRSTTIGGDPILNDHGRVAFPAKVAGPGITQNLNSGGTWVETVQGVDLLAQDDMIAPGPGADIRILGLQWPRQFNNSGQVGLFSLIKGTGIALGNRHGLFVSAPDGCALSGLALGTDPAPGIGDDAVLLEADLLQLNDAGQAAFTSNYASPAGEGTGVWRFNAVTGHELVVRSGDAAPETTGAVFDAVSSSLLNQSGQIMFQGHLSGGDATSANDSGLWRADAGGEQMLLIREGEPAPGTANGVNFSVFYIADFNYAGRIAFQGGLRGPGVTASNNFGVWSNGATGTLQLLARQGSPAPGTPAGVVFGPGAAGGAVFPFPVLNNAGHTAFFSELTGSSVNSANNVGLWSDAGGEGLELIMREGSLAPGAGEGVRFSFRLQDEGGFTATFLDDGRLAFGSRLVGAGVTAANNQGIWAHDLQGALQLIVRTQTEPRDCSSLT
jgi:hypothetical protein